MPRGHIPRPEQSVLIKLLATKERRERKEYYFGVGHSCRREILRLDRLMRKTGESKLGVIFLCSLRSFAAIPQTDFGYSPFSASQRSFVWR